jgi:hypothetical protein
VLLLYVAFSLFAYGVLMDQVNRIVQLGGDLYTISGNVSNASGISRYMLRGYGEVDPAAWAPRWPLAVALIGTFLGSVAYVMYAYQGTRKRRKT